jgi:hypothetical protein
MGYSYREWGTKKPDAERARVGAGEWRGARSGLTRNRCETIAKTSPDALVTRCVRP